MPRTHIVQSWVGACEFDEGDTYSGEQIGNRNQKSIGVLIERSGDQWKVGNVDQNVPTFINGRANIAGFSDPVSKPKQTKPSPTAFEKICTSDRTYEKLCNLSEELDQQLDAKQIDWNDHIYARKQLDTKLDRAWKNVCKNRGWNELLEPSECYPTVAEFTLDFEPKTQRKYDYSVIPSDSVFAELQDGNIFKKFYTILLTGYRALAKIAVTSKKILEEGLV